MLRLKTILDKTGFRRAVIGIAAASTGIPIRGVIKAEVGSILKACAGNTKVAKKRDVTDRQLWKTTSMEGLTKAGRDAALGTVTVNSGRNRRAFGGVWVKTKGTIRSGKQHQPWRWAGQVSPKNFSFTPGNEWRAPAQVHWADSDWANIQSAVKRLAGALQKAVPAALAAIGLARQSWVQIADDLGLPLEKVPGGRLSAAGIAKARKALASDGKPYVNGHAQEYDLNRQYFIELVNRLPYGRKIALDAILVRNVNARVRYFQTNVSRGVFNHLKQVARAYPGLRIDVN